jgi:hypothetical protein
MAKEQEIGAYSAYAIAVEHGYVGTEEDWIEEQERNRKASEQAASDAESAKTAAEVAQRAAENAKKAAESSAGGAAGEAQKAQTSAAQAASSAAYAGEAGIAAGEAQKAAESAKSAAAVSASLAQESAAQAAGSAESADSAKTAASQSEQRTAASEANVAQAEERINKTVSGAVEAVTAQETKSVQAVAAEGERVLGTIPADYTAAVGEIDALKKSKAEIDDTAIDGDTWSSKHIADMLCPKIEKSGTPVQMDGLVEGYPLGVKVSWTPTQEGSGDPSPENIRPIKGRDSVRVERREDDLAYTLTLPSTVYGGEVDAVTGEGQREWRCITITGREPCHIYSTLFYIDFYQTDSFVQEPAIDSTSGKSSHYPYQLYGKNGFIGITLDGGAVVYSPGDKYPNTNDGLREWMDYLAAQYAAGTPVQICYKQANPVPFTATGGATIPLLSGTNTVLTDADSVTVTGRADPIQTIAKLSDRIAALEAAATNITE